MNFLQKHSRATPLPMAALGNLIRRNGVAMTVCSALSGMILTSPPVSAQNPDVRPRYEVSISASKQEAVITLALPAGTSALQMDSIQADHLPAGWATHVRQLEVVDGGEGIRIDSTGRSRWRLSAAANTPITIRYRVDLAFGAVPWAAGNEQAAATFDDALYVVGRALFIESDAPGARVVEFVLPEGWHVSTPWTPIDSSGRRYRATGPDALVRNPLVVGRHRSIRVASGDFQLELALPGEVRDAGPLVEPTVQRVLDAYLRLFPGTPPTRYLMTFFRSYADDGEGFVDGGSFTTTEPVTSRGMIIWGNFLAHELFHFWNGQRIRGVGPRAEWRWMAEGFTEYFANVIMAREGVVDSDLFSKKVERHLGNYLYFMTSPGLARRSLLEAGTNTSAYRFGVYDGGWTMALCLDGLIREGSGDRRSLDDFMTTLWRQRQAGADGYSLAQLDRLANELAGRDLGGIIAQGVTGTRALPIGECLARFGLVGEFKGMAAEAFVFRDQNAPATVRARARTWAALP